MTGGRNGYGAKLTNVFSKKFSSEMGDATRGKLFKQQFSWNLSEISTPEVTEYSRDMLDYTSVSFVPDLKRFGMKTLSDDIVALFSKRVLDIAGTTAPSVRVFLNGKRLDSAKNFKQLAEQYLGPELTERCVHERVNDRWEVVVAPSPDS